MIHSRGRDHTSLPLDLCTCVGRRGVGGISLVPTEMTDERTRLLTLAEAGRAPSPGLGVDEGSGPAEFTGKGARHIRAEGGECGGLRWARASWATPAIGVVFLVVILVGSLVMILNAGGLGVSSLTSALGEAETTSTHLRNAVHEVAEPEPASQLGASADSSQKENPPSDEEMSDLGTPVGKLMVRCSGAFMEPTKRAPLALTKYGGMFGGVIRYAQRVYMICTDKCDELVMPNEWNNVLLVNGISMDACTRQQDKSHWVKASHTHAMVSKHAFEGHADVNYIAVLEQDTVADTNVGWTHDAWPVIENTLEQREWNLFRMAYRPYDFEASRRFGQQDAVCPEECKCKEVSSLMCMTQSPGCALQSSDAYMVHRRAYKRIVDMVKEDKVIDYDVFKLLDKQVLFRPYLGYQEEYAPDDFISSQETKRANSHYLDKCWLP